MIKTKARDNCQWIIWYVNTMWTGWSWGGQPKLEDRVFTEKLREST